MEMSLSMFFWISLLKLSLSAPAGVHVGKDGSVGASWGGYSAGAGLGNGLFAQARTPDGYQAATGLGNSASGRSKSVVVTQSVAPVDVVPAKLVPVAGAFEASSSSSSSSSAGFPNQNVVLSHHVPPVNVIPPAGGSSKTSSSSSAFQENFSINKNPQNGFFDGIFNIPISTLTAVNQYLNNRGKGANASASSSGSVGSSFSRSAGASSTSDSGITTANNHVNREHNVQLKPQPNYDGIFNIPISVLSSVNRFLNGK